MKHLKKALEDNGFKEIHQDVFSYDAKGVCVDVFLKDKIFKVSDADDIIKEGGITELPYEYQTLFHKHFTYPIVSNLIDLEFQEDAAKTKILSIKDAERGLMKLFDSEQARPILEQVDYENSDIHKEIITVAEKLNISLKDNTTINNIPNIFDLPCFNIQDVNGKLELHKKSETTIQSRIDCYVVDTRKKVKKLRLNSNECILIAIGGSSYNLYEVKLFCNPTMFILAESRSLAVGLIDGYINLGKASIESISNNPTEFEQSNWGGISFRSIVSIIEDARYQNCALFFRLYTDDLKKIEPCETVKIFDKTEEQQTRILSYLDDTLDQIKNKLFKPEKEYQAKGPSDKYGVYKVSVCDREYKHPVKFVVANSHAEARFLYGNIDVNLETEYLKPEKLKSFEFEDGQLLFDFFISLSSQTGTLAPLKCVTEFKIGDRVLVRDTRITSGLSEMKQGIIDREIVGVVKHIHEDKIRVEYQDEPHRALYYFPHELKLEATPRQELFNFFADNHDLTLIETELDDAIEAVSGYIFKTLLPEGLKDLLLEQRKLEDLEKAEALERCKNPKKVKYVSVARKEKAYTEDEIGDLFKKLNLYRSGFDRMFKSIDLSNLK